MRYSRNKHQTMVLYYNMLTSDYHLRDKIVLPFLCSLFGVSEKRVYEILRNTETHTELCVPYIEVHKMHIKAFVSEVAKGKIDKQEYVFLSE